MKSEERLAIAVSVYALLITALVILYVGYLQSKVAETFASVFLVTVALLVTLYFNSVEPLRDIALGDEFEKYKDKKNDDLFKIVYEQLGNEIRGRDNLTIVAGSIMVSASLILLGILAELRLNPYYSTTLGMVMVMVIMSIFTIWFIGFNLTSRKLNRVAYVYLHKMEEARGFKLHGIMLEKVENEIWWKYLRRTVWIFFFYVLTASCILLLLI